MAAPGFMPLCVTTHTATYIHGDSFLNLVKSASRYRLHMTIRRTTRAYNGTILTKMLFIMCLLAKIIRIIDKIILRVNDSGIIFDIIDSKT